MLNLEKLKETMPNYFYSIIVGIDDQKSGAYDDFVTINS